MYFSITAYAMRCCMSKPPRQELTDGLTGWQALDWLTEFLVWKETETQREC